jgi:hypothetical protein
MEPPITQRFNGRFAMHRQTFKDTLNVVEWGRFGAERCVLMPAASHLPAEFGQRVAGMIGRADAAIPLETRNYLRRDLAAATGVRGRALGDLLRERLAVPRRDLAWRQRFRLGYEEFADWEVIEQNAGPVQELIAAKVSFVLAGAHFPAAAADLRHKILPRLGREVHGETPGRSLNPFELRRRMDSQTDEGAGEGLMHMQTGGRFAPELMALMPDLWGRQTDWASTPPFPDVQEKLLDELRRPGSVNQILVDAHWEKPNAYRRPFAGIAERGFALGAARIARIAQCPVVPLVAVLGPSPRSVIYEWGDPIWPGVVDDTANDRKVIDAALDFLEQGVARYPTQYLHPIGHERHWDASQAAWVERRR